MKEKVLSALKTKYSNLGFSEKAFTGVADYLAATVQDDTQIETATAGVEQLLKAFQGDIDTRVTAALAKQKAELKTEPPAQPPAAPPQPKSGDDTPAWAKALLDKVENLEKREKRESLLSKLKGKIKDDVPESFLRGRSITIETEDQVDQLAAMLKDDYTAFKQDMINKGVMIDLPKKPATAGREGEELAKKMAEQRNTGTSDGLVGKKI